MKKIFCECKTVEEANAIVKSLLTDGYSAYRQNLKVYIDDGGVDEG